MEKAKIGLDTQEHAGLGGWSLIILNRMENVCEEEDNEGISAAHNQFGFRKGLSTHHA